MVVQGDRKFGPEADSQNSLKPKKNLPGIFRLGFEKARLLF